MSRKIVWVFAGVLVAIGVSACQMTKSEHPLGPTVAGPIPGVDITPPTPLEPAQGFRIAVAQQPISLTLGNAVSTGVRPLNYLFEVATDAGFANKVFSLDGIAPGESGRTVVRLPNALAPERSYYWRARAQDGANTGPFSSAAFFNVFTPVVLGKPEQPPAKDCTEPAAKLLECLGLDDPDVKRVRVKSVSLTIDLEHGKGCDCGKC